MKEETSLTIKITKIKADSLYRVEIFTDNDKYKGSVRKIHNYIKGKK